MASDWTIEATILYLTKSCQRGGPSSQAPRNLSELGSNYTASRDFITFSLAFGRGFLLIGKEKGWANPRSGLYLISYRGASSAAISLRHQREDLCHRTVASLAVSGLQVDPRFKRSTRRSPKSTDD